MVEAQRGTKVISTDLNSTLCKLGGKGSNSKSNIDTKLQSFSITLLKVYIDTMDGTASLRLFVSRAYNFPSSFSSFVGLEVDSLLPDRIDLYVDSTSDFSSSGSGVCTYVCCCLVMMNYL